MKHEASKNEELYHTTEETLVLVSTVFITYHTPQINP